ncbi:MAG: hypothetical protein ACKPA7_10480, partial [Sphaerospermopsis kisseleviana]
YQFYEKAIFRMLRPYRSQESGGDLKISLPSLEIPKNAHFFRYTVQNPGTNFCVYQPLTFDISRF